MHQLSGTISIKVKALRQKILDLSSLIELELDFIEEGIDLLKYEDLKEKLLAIQGVIDEMISSNKQGRMIREGIKVVITGKPNVGKSSILNSLLNYDRAIVSEVPGTTRDTLEENISIEGFLFSVTDTAGLHRTADEVEGLGIERARRELKNADVILYVSDASIGTDKEDLQTLRDCELEAEKISATMIWLQNKVDLIDPRSELIELSLESRIPPKRISAKTREGIDSLRAELVDLASAGAKNLFDSSSTITNQRHKRCLERARELLDLAILLASDKSKSELIAANLNSATNALGEVIGLVTTEDVLNNIFSKFCIGK
jgi:tRNA modification GTPase